MALLMIRRVRINRSTMLWRLHMFHVFPFSKSSRQPYRGSTLLHSGPRRVLRVLPCVACLWGLTAWAMGWW